MGIIRKQTVSGSFFSYIGVLLGFINLAVLSPKVFSTEQIGLPALIIAISAMVSQFGSLGFNNVTIRLFPHFRNKTNHHNGFLGLSIIVQSFGLILAMLAMVIFIPYLINRNSDDISMLGEFAYLIIPLIVFQIYFTLFDSFCRVLFNATLGIVLKEFVVRVLNLLIILLFFYDVISFRYFMYLYVFAFGVPTLVLLLYLIIRGEFSLKTNFSFINKDMKREIITVSIYGIIAGLSGLAVANIDKYMINDLLNLSAVGIYAIAFSFGTLILIPGRAMSKIAAPVIAEFWKENNIGKILEVYKKSSVNQFIGGIAVFMLIWINIDDIFNLMKGDYSDGRFVILFISLANVMTALSGVSIQILGTSKSFRYHSFFMIALIVLVIVSNIVLIPIWGITGAAAATFISTSLYVLMSTLFLHFKYGIQPLGLSHITSFLSGFVPFILVSALPLSFEPIINIGIRVALSGGLFSLMVYFLKCSPDINIVVDNFILRILRKGRN